MHFEGILVGAAAFLMVEYVGITYIEVIKHAFLPAIISYVALVYIVHLEACKMGLEGMKKTITKTAAQRLMSFVLSFLKLVVFADQIEQIAPHLPENCLR